jgi:ankyrin repeat protein
MGKHFMTNVVFFLLLITSSLFSMEQDTKESKITVGDFSSRIPKEVFLRICATPTIKYTYPWEAIAPIFQLQLVCTAWRDLVSEHQEYIATLLDIPLIHWYAAIGDVDMIAVRKVGGKCSVKGPDKNKLSPGDYALGAEQKKSWKILKIGDAVKLKEGQALPAGFSDSIMPERKYTLQDVIDALNSDSTALLDTILSVIMQDGAMWVPLLRKIDWTQSSLQLSRLNPMCYLHLSYALQCNRENELFEHIYAGETLPEIFWEIFKKVNANYNAYDFEGFTALHRACMIPERSWLVEELLKQDDIDVNCQSKCGLELTPLHITVLPRNPNHKALEALLSTKKCMINISSLRAGTALHYAAAKNDGTAVKLLIDHKADIYSKNESCANATPIHHAAGNENTDSLVHFFATPGCQLEVKDGNDCTPIWYAVRSDSSNCVLYLLNKGAAINGVTIGGGQTLLRYAIEQNSRQCLPILLGKLGDTINRTDGQGAVHCAVRSGKSHLIKQLVNARASVNLADTDGNTPLHYAAHLGDSATIAELYKHGAAINSVASIQNWAPIHYAVYNGNLNAVTALVQYNADTTVQTQLGKTALDIATDRGHTDIVEFLQEHDRKCLMREMQ